MVALCREHADKADNGAYTVEQVRRFKVNGASNADKVTGRFDWMRRELVAHIGGLFMVDVAVLIEINGTPVVWFDRNEFGELSLSYRLATAGKRRTTIVNNTWTIEQDDIQEVICPPGGRTLSVEYVDGSRFSVEFREIATQEEFLTRFPHAKDRYGSVSLLHFPVTVVSVVDVSVYGNLKIKADRIEEHSNKQTLSGWSFGSKSGLSITGRGWYFDD